MNALNFKKALTKSPNMIALRLHMRDEFRRELRNLTVQDFDDPNRDIFDPYQGDKEFKKIVNKMVNGLSVRHVEPEEMIITQNDPILDNSD